MFSWNNAMLAALILLVATAPGFGQTEKDIPYTSNSPEALQYLQTGFEFLMEINIDSANAAFGKAVAADPQMAIGYYYLTNTANNTEDFLGRLHNAVRLAPNASEPERLLIQIAKDGSEGKTSQMDQAYRQLITLLPGSKTAHFNYANFLAGLQRIDEAETQYKKVIELAPSFARGYNEYAYFLAQQGKYSEALENLKKYAELRPKEANAHDSMGEIYLYNGDHENSISEYNKSLSLDNGFTFSLVGLGHNYTFLAKYDLAREQYAEVSKRAHSNADTITSYFWTGVSYVYERNFDKAIEMFKQESDFGKSRGDIYNETNAYDNLVASYREKGDLAGALAALAKYRELASRPEINPATAKIFQRSCMAYEVEILALQGNFEQANAKLAQYFAFIKGEENPAIMRGYHDIAGRVAYLNKDYSTAIAELKQSDPQNSYAKYYLGLSFEKAGQKEKAQKVFLELSKHNRNNLGYAFIRSAAIARL